MAATSRGRALIIDDEEATRGLLVDVVRLAGYEVDEAATGEEGLAKSKARAYELVLTDHLMPGMKGSTVVEALRAERPTIRVIVITGSPGAAELDPIRRLDVTVLHKPVTVAELLAVIGGRSRSSPGAGRGRVDG